MQTEILKLTDSNRKEVLEKASLIIKNGGLVVFPTETVYGLGASVYNEEAIKKIFKAKGRPSDNPIIVHIAKEEQLQELTDDVSPIQQKLMDSFWPGPLTIIFKKKQNISSIVSGGLSSIAIRMPSHSFARELIARAGVPIAAPSANISGRPSGTKGVHLFEDLMEKVDMIIDAGLSQIGIESTVVRVEGDSVFILRPGAVTEEMLKKVVVPARVIFTEKKNMLNSSPGTRYKHYAPCARLILEVASKILERATSLQKEGLAVGIISTNQNKDFFKIYEPNVFSLGDENNLEEISQSLYQALRFFDTHHVDVIVCQSFPEQGLGRAIMDRLIRASGGEI
ncbi:threonylcarbamoyl-AMP synthase [Candidatus Nomurabacteria bacterium RIFCSPLOWO2_01_FULL_40_15]|uniref:Threonylcarbamoyl-AMP synthase n=1 Tax=Candidatus Nomurabacteria bacterium RIFCSPLOWO2_01_FULL_40_15 TaxID=1801772 RepID=A0A1F6X4U3_9BACT|nr:MAG: threonylcarbamoyl-AMP synthase [Candidatus Nomurabacteria bacterium RIFCSPLOWO2_01_FULL_40_15]